MKSLKELQLAIRKEIADERNAEIKAIKLAKKEAEREAEIDQKIFSKHFNADGNDIKKYAAYEKELASSSNSSIKEIRTRLIGDNKRIFSLSADEIQASSIDTTLLSDKNQIVYPSSVQAFSTQEETEDEFATMDVVYGNSRQNRSTWARGAGSGIAGSGAGSNTQWVEFGFWFRPSVSRNYSIIPQNIFRGFYIARANDRWFNSKEVKASVNIWINVHQYNWKGWSSHNVLSVNSQNISRNSRLDTNRTSYHSALLGRNDWAFIRVAVGMHVYARGSGSYAELNFSSGNSNYLECPYCIIS